MMPAMRCPVVRCRVVVRFVVPLLLVASASSQPYPDGRPYTALRMEATDAGRILRHGEGPAQCDALGAREAIVFAHDGQYYLHYDGAGPDGWRACLAVSRDLKQWECRGPVLSLGAAGTEDSACAASPWVIEADGRWHMFYLGTPNATAPPHLVPSFPYLTMKAVADHPEGPWRKQYEVTPFRTQPGTYYARTASPGQVVPKGDEYLMFFSTTAPGTKRTLGIARTRDLNGPWTPDPEPIVPVEEQVENSSLYFEPANDTWFLFTNHIGLTNHEYTDAVWVYWTQDLEHWDPADKAVVLDGRNCTWAARCIGMPSVIPVGNRLAVFYDSPGGVSTSHMGRDIGLAWLELPLGIPAVRPGTAEPPAR